MVLRIVMLLGKDAIGWCVLTKTKKCMGISVEFSLNGIIDVIAKNNSCHDGGSNNY